MMNESVAELRLAAQDQRRLDDLYDRLRREEDTLVGYPCSALFDYRPLYRFLDYPLNNVGNTMKGAVDDLDGVRSVLHDLAIHRHYLHADAALSGMILPFVDAPPPWDFRAGVDSIAISGHKMIGSPVPCGVALACKAHV